MAQPEKVPWGTQRFAKSKQKHYAVDGGQAAIAPAIISTDRYCEPQAKQSLLSLCFYFAKLCILCGKA